MNWAEESDGFEFARVRAAALVLTSVQRSGRPFVANTRIFFTPSGYGTAGKVGTNALMLSPVGRERLKRALALDKPRGERDGGVSLGCHDWSFAAWIVMSR